MTLSEKLKEQQNKDILLFLGDSLPAEADWLAAGGDKTSVITPKQIVSWLMTGMFPVPDKAAFKGSIDEFIALFPKEDIENSKTVLNKLLANSFLGEFKNNTWEFFSCNVTVMGCCMGEYFSVVNRKEL